MKIAVVTDSLSHLSFEDLLNFATNNGVGGLEFATGNWSKAPHLDLNFLMSDRGARLAFRQAIEAHGLELVALNANGNQLHPQDGARQDRTLRQTIALAAELNVQTICLMSGLPAGGPDDRTPNWVTSSWPPETSEILDWQWNERLLPYWTELAKFARDHGVTALCVELHGNQLVYNVPSFLRLRGEIGPIVGANLDPSHLLWMGADPLAAINHLGPMISHVHAKDTRLNPPVVALTSRLDNGSPTGVASRAWSYVTLGYGQSLSWWRQFCFQLRVAGYDGWLSIEHEDEILAREEGVQKSIDLLKAAAPHLPSDYAMPQL